MIRCFILRLLGAPTLTVAGRLPVVRNSDELDTLIARRHLSMMIGTQAADVIVYVIATKSERNDMVRHGRGADNALGFAHAA